MMSELDVRSFGPLPETPDRDAEAVAVVRRFATRRSGPTAG